MLPDSVQASKSESSHDSGIVNRSPIPPGLLALLLFAMLLKAWFIRYVGDIDFEPDSYLHFIFSASSIAALPSSLNWAAGAWPKPLFTLLAGFVILITGIHKLWVVKLMNVAIWSVISYCVYRLGRKLDLSYRAALMASVLTECSFLAFPGSVGSLTEPLFALTVILALLLAYERRFIASALVMSMSALARSEGLFLIVGWAAVMFFVFQRRRILEYSLLPLFPALWDLWGFSLTGNPIFIISSGYDVISIYGHGTWLYYPIALAQYEPIIFPLCLVGLVMSGRQARFAPLHVLFFVYMGFHILAWRFGLFSSAGILRYFVPVMPLMAIYAVYGLGSLARHVTRFWPSIRRSAATPILVLLAILQLGYTLRMITSHTEGYHLYNSPTVNHNIVDAGRLIAAEYPGAFLYATHPATIYYARRDFYSSAIVLSATDIQREGLAAFDTDSGSSELFSVLQSQPLVRQYEHYLYIYKVAPPLH